MRARAPGLSALLGHLAALSEDAAAWPAPCTTLTEAAVRGEAAAVAAFLDGGHDIDERTIGFASPLAAAAGRGHLEVVELLLARGASLAPPGALFPLLAFPISNDRVAVVRRLLAAGVPAEPYRRHLRLAAGQGRWAMVEALLEAGLPAAELDTAHQAGLAAWRALGRPPLAPATPAPPTRARLDPSERARHEAQAVALVEKHGAPLASARLGSGTTLLAQAVCARSRALVRALLAAGAAPDESGSGSSPLVEAAGRGDVDLLALLLDAGADPGRADAQRVAPVVAAARSGVLAALELLLERGARPAARERRLARAAACGPGRARMLALLA